MIKPLLDVSSVRRRARLSAGADVPKAPGYAAAVRPRRQEVRIHSRSDAAGFGWRTDVCSDGGPSRHLGLWPGGLSMSGLSREMPVWATMQIQADRNAVRRTWIPRGNAERGEESVWGGRTTLAKGVTAMSEPRLPNPGWNGKPLGAMRWSFRNSLAGPRGWAATIRVEGAKRLPADQRVRVRRQSASRSSSGCADASGSKQATLLSRSRAGQPIGAAAIAAPG